MEFVMSLQVWLPLNGNLDNIGLSNVTVTNNGATIDNNGKIGKCYSFSSNKYLTINKPLISSNKFSFCGWYKFSSLSTYCIATCRTAAGNGIALHIFSEGSLRLDVESAGQYSSTGLISVNKWIHIAATYDGKEKKIYIDGNLVHSQVVQISSFTNLNQNGWSICGAQTGSSLNPTGNFLSGLVNDFRIYDHCLSPKEVHDIAQGLVLHYTLDGTNETRLPLGYKQLEYIESTGNSYFNTGYKFNVETDYCKVVFKGNDLSNNGMIFASSGSKYFWLYYYGASGIRVYADNGTGQQGIPGISRDTEKHTMEWKNKHYYIDNIDKGTLSNTYEATSNNIWLFSYGNSGYPFKGRIYYCEIISDNIYKRIFIPAQRLSDNVNGMYDIVTDTFYVSSNEGFIASTTSVSPSTIYDTSGYCNHGTIAGNLNVSNDTPRYNSSTTFRISMIETPYKNIGLDEFTYSAWIKLNSYVTPNGVYSQYDDRCVISAGINTYFTISSDGKLSCYAYGKDPAGYHNGTTTIPLNTWTHVAVVWTKTQVIGYVNGVQDFAVNCIGSFNRDGVQYIGAQPRSTDISTPIRILDGNISDLRYYATALSADDILRLYNTSAYIDDAGNTYSYDFDECIRYDSTNMLLKVEMALCKKQFANGLSNYQQTHCKCTLTDDGYRIYRTPNLTYPDSGSVMWGGFVLDNASNRFGLQKGHTYVVEFDIKGQTTNAVSDMYWTCQVGWGGGECECHPTNIQKMNPVTANYNSSKWRHVSYKFTVSDDVWKECTANYNSNSFVAGNSYVSYRHFKFGFGYTSTGELGTDLYIKNLRMFDITTGESKMNVTANGLIESTYVIENDDNAFVDSFGEMNAKTLVEF